VIKLGVALLCLVCADIGVALLELVIGVVIWCMTTCIRFAAYVGLAPYMTVYLVVFLPKIPYIHRIYMVLANPMHMLYGRTTP